MEKPIEHDEDSRHAQPHDPREPEESFGDKFTKIIGKLWEVIQRLFR